MEKLDRLGWAEGMAFTAYGVRVGIRATEPGALAAVPTLLPPGWKPASKPLVEQLYSLVVGGSGARRGVRRLFLLYRGYLRVARERELEPVLDALKSDVRLWVAERAQRRVFVHAGVVAWNDKAIVVPGRSHSGKSALVAELLRSGATYYSDEYAVFDAKGRVHPFPVPLSVREPGKERSGARSPETFGAETGRQPVPVGVVAVAPFREGGRWRPRRLSKGQGALALLANTVSARRSPEKALSALRAAVEGAVVMKGTRGEASDVAGRLLDLAKAEAS